MYHVREKTSKNINYFYKLLGARKKLKYEFISFLELTLNYKNENKSTVHKVLFWVAYLQWRMEGQTLSRLSNAMEIDKGPYESTDQFDLCFLRKE